MSTFIPKKQDLREVLRHYFILKKSAAETHRLLVDIYVEHVPLKTTCKEWFRRFNNADFDVNNKERGGAPNKFEDAQLQASLDEDRCRSLKELSKKVNVDKSTVGKCIPAMGMVQNEGNWVLHKLKERHQKTFGHVRDAASTSTKERFLALDYHWRWKMD